MSDEYSFYTAIQVSVFDKSKAIVYKIPLPAELMERTPPDLWAFSNVTIKIVDSDIVDLGSRKVSKNNLKRYVSIPVKIAREKGIAKGTQVFVTLKWK